YIYSIPHKMTIKEFFVKLTTRELSPDCNIDIINPEAIECIEISKVQDATATQVSINCNIIKLQQIRNHGGGLSTQSYANTQGKQFVTSLTEIIWYIDMRDHQKFKDRSYHIPELFLEFFGYANPESYKQSQKSFNANELYLHSAQFLEGKVANTVTAIDECRHDPIVHLATTISVNDLLYQIKKEYLSEIAIPSTQWLQLQFWPKNLTRLSSLQFTNDKHRCKVGEPGFPVAAVEREKKVVVNRNTTFAVADYDYTKIGIIPNVIMICNIPESINADFYVGK
ncbi:896_t:CDS:2, partial [Scutellospora calospora]